MLHEQRRHSGKSIVKKFSSRNLEAHWRKKPTKIKSYEEDAISIA